MTTKSGGKSGKKTAKTSSTTPKKKTRRELTKYKALDPNVNLLSRRDLLDFDYLHKLNDEEMKFLSKFIDETVHDAFDRDDLSNNLYATTKVRKKECDDMNNARNRDVSVKSKMLNKLDGLEKATHVGHSEENRLHASIDLAIEINRRLLLIKT